MDTPSGAQGDDLDEPTTSNKSQVDEILRQRRKARTTRACYPCRQRKVRCPYGTPCQRCIDRQHPDLCSYQQAPKNPDPEPSSQLRAPSLPEGEKPPAAELNHLWSKLESVQHLLLEVKGNLGGQPLTAGVTPPQLPPAHAVDEHDAREAHVAPPGIQARSGLVGDFVHLGRNSVPAMAIALGDGGTEEVIQNIIGKSVLPLFGLDNESATYPFVDLWGLPTGSPRRVAEICKLLPSDADCFQFLRQYRDTAHILYPGVVDLDQLEAELTQFLVSRSSQPLEVSSSNVDGSSTVYGKSLHWLSLTFACLASGCQASPLSRKERALTSQVYVCCAYECLRSVNYLSRPTTADIQSLLTLGNVIANSMNVGVAWSLLGLTIRLAQTIGLHEASQATVTTPEILLQQEVWWRVIWQDSLLSITFDRAPSSFIHFALHAHPPQPPGPDGISYVESMKMLCKTGLDIVQERTLSSADFHRELANMLKGQEDLTEISNQAAAHLREVTACRSIKDQLEHYSFHLHISFVTSELFRPLLKRQKLDTEETTRLREICIKSLGDTVTAFLGLQNVTPSVKTSWAVLQKALSSALLLGIIREPSANVAVRTLLERFMSVMLDLNSDLGPSEIPAPLSRSIAGLRRLLALHRESDSHRSRAADYFKTGEQASAQTSTESSPLDLEKQSERSPYALRDSILWGGPGHGMVLDQVLQGGTL